MVNQSKFVSWPSKQKRLEDIIQDVATHKVKIFVGFSGGVDSSYLLLKTAAIAGVEKVVAVTVLGPTCAHEDAQGAVDFANKLGVAHLVLNAPEFENPSFLENSPSRCYHCKLSRYEAILRLSGNPSEVSVFDGSQADDDPNDRPGSKAIDELGVMTPLARAGINKQEIRNELLKLGFRDLADKQAEPCLATRIPFGRPLIVSELETVKTGEEYLRNNGIRFCRLRHHGDLARIVTDSEGLQSMLADEALRKRLVILLKSLGFKHITLDMEEYS